MGHGIASAQRPGAVGAIVAEVDRRSGKVRARNSPSPMIAA